MSKSCEASPVNPAERYHFADFTRENYRRLLRLAKQAYTFRGFTDFRADERFVLWRHDVDFSVHAAAKLAAIEAEENVRATYFIHLHSQFYNALEGAVSAKVREILGLGHALGLHFDSHYYGIAQERELETHLRFERELLERLFGHEVRAFSFHNSTPFTMSCRRAEYAGMVHVHAAYFQDEVGYCSDSNGYWRFQRLEDVLRAATDERLQVLTHPAWWQDDVLSPKDRVERCIRGRADATRRDYETLLRENGRENVDHDASGSVLGRER